MILRECYASTYIPTSRHETIQNYLYNTVLKYPEEDLEKYNNRYEQTLSEYVRYDVKKYFGLNINEYLDLTYKEKNIMLEVCVKEAKHAIDIANKAREASDQNINSLKKDMSKPIAKPEPRLDGFDLAGMFGEE